MLLSVCQDRFKIYPFSDVPHCWRELHSAASCLNALSIIHFQHEQAPAEPLKILDAIKRLDEASIISGVTNLGIDSNFASHINDLQKILRKAPQPTFISSAFELCQQRTSVVQERDLFPSSHRFATEAWKRPFIVRGAAKDWPAVKGHAHDDTRHPSSQWRCWANGEYLHSQAGPGRVVPVEVGADYTKEGWSQGLMPFAMFLRRAGWSFKRSPWDTAANQAEPERDMNKLTSVRSPENDTRPVYLAQFDLLRMIPELAKDVQTPELAWSVMPTPDWRPDYKGPAEPVQNVWFGPPQMTSPAHTDPYYNLYSECRIECNLQC